MFLLWYLAATTGTVCLAVAAAAAWQAGRSHPRWLFSFGCAVLGAESALIGLAAQPDAADAWSEWRVIVTSATWLPWLAFSFRYARGQRRLASFARWCELGLLVVPALLWLAHEHLLGAVLDHREHALASGGYAAAIVGLLCAIAVLINLERTFRAAVGTTRWRIKFALLGVGLVFATRVYTQTGLLLLRRTDAALDVANLSAVLVAMPLLLWSLHRAAPFDLDVYPSGPLLRNSLTAMVVAAYLFVVGVLAKVITAFDEQRYAGLKPLLVLVAIVLLAVALQSDRVRWTVARFVDRHFHRPLHDHRAVWRRFTAATVTRFDPDELCRSVAVLIADVFGALSVRVWLLNDNRDLLQATASTTAPTQSAPAIEAAPILARFATDHGPVDLDSPAAGWSAMLRRCHPTDFTNGGHRVCAPLVVRAEFLGVVTVGDRVNGAPFTTEEFELLQCMADHAAATLRGAQLTQRLSQAKQLEAFQTMAAFFVHDLKNAASTLKLMLQNLPAHFGNPAFRADALRGIGATVGHIEELIGRLTALRHELRVNAVDTDLNELVAQALAGIGPLPGASITRHARPVPRIPLDPEQVHKVITNLVLNAADAVATDGRIEVATSAEEGWVVLTVNDNGCGMTDDFITHSLFRPFQTTKRHGLGIGMFQSKMIIEAHGGRIAVSSEVGRGTQFQVFLRTTPASN